jgi:murein L,D-transpeptidase YafK
MIRSRYWSRAVIAITALLASAVVAAAVTIELKDVAPDRVERQRAAAVGSLPLPGTPDIGNLDKRLASKGLKAGDAIFIRIFKAESELEIWLRSGSRFVLLDTYPICHWSGTIGPKIHEGDKQTPEGFYEVTRQQLHLIGRHPRSLNLGFPNAYDKSMQRTGSYILVHGGCSSVGCFAMTNTVIAEIYDLAERALKSGQDRVQVHVFPFRMTDANMQRHGNSEWLPFWTNLKEGYDAFEQTKLPPQVGICEKRYHIQASAPGEEAAPGPLAVCGETLAAVSEWDRLTTAAQQQLSKSSHPQPRQATLRPQDRLYPLPRQPRLAASQLAASQSPEAQVSSLPRRFRLQQSPLLQRAPQPRDEHLQQQHANGLQQIPQSPLPGRSSLGAAVTVEAVCDPNLPSCRRWKELRKKAEVKALAMRDGQPAPGPKRKTASRTR